MAEESTKSLRLRGNDWVSQNFVQSLVRRNFQALAPKNRRPAIEFLKLLGQSQDESSSTPMLSTPRPPSGHRKSRDGDPAQLAVAGSEGREIAAIVWAGSVGLGVSPVNQGL